MKFSVILLLSIILNLALGFNLYFKKNSGLTTPASANYPTDSEALTNTPVLESSFDYKTYYHELLALGLSHTQSKQLLIKELEDNQGSVISKKSDPYWKATNESTSALIRQRLVNQQAIREKLVALFGISAWDEPPFKSVFRPLQAQFPFLLPQEQIELQRLQVEHQVNLATKKQKRFLLNSNSRGANSTKLPSVSQPSYLDVRAVLSKASALEYGLRMSPLSNQLRHSSVAFNEKEFRKTYQLLADLEIGPLVGKPNENMLSIKTLIDYREDLEGILGPERTLKVMTAIDPEFHLLQQKAMHLKLDDQQLMKVYTIALDARETLMNGIRIKHDNPEIGLQMIREAASNHWNQLSLELGDDITRQLLGSSSHQVKNNRPQVLTPQTNTINN